MEIIIVLSILIVVAVASVAWGVDSRDGLNSEEWKRRRSTLYHSPLF